MRSALRSVVGFGHTIWNWNREVSVVKTVKIAVALFVAAALSSCVVAPAPVVVEPVVPFVFGGIYIHGGHGGYRGGHRR